MKKLLLPLLIIFALVLVACGAPAVDPETVEVEVEVTRLVEVEVPSEPEIVEVEVEVTAQPPEPTAIVNWGILYLQVTGHTVLWELVGETDEGVFLFERFDPRIHYALDDIVLAYNGLGDEEFYLNADGDLALDGPDFPNAQDFFTNDDGDTVAEFIGRWSGFWIDVEGNTRSQLQYYYKVAGPEGAGLYILAEDVVIPLCENLILAVPESCDQ